MISFKFKDFKNLNIEDFNKINLKTSPSGIFVTQDLNKEIELKENQNVHSNFTFFADHDAEYREEVSIDLAEVLFDRILEEDFLKVLRNTSEENFKIFDSIKNARNKEEKIIANGKLEKIFNEKNLLNRVWYSFYQMTEAGIFNDEFKNKTQRKSDFFEDVLKEKFDFLIKEKESLLILLTLNEFLKECSKYNLFIYDLKTNNVYYVLNELKEEVVLINVNNYVNKSFEFEKKKDNEIKDFEEFYFIQKNNLTNEEDFNRFINYLNLLRNKRENVILFNFYLNKKENTLNNKTFHLKDLLNNELNERVRGYFYQEENLKEFRDLAELTEDEFKNKIENIIKSENNSNNSSNLNPLNPLNPLEKIFNLILENEEILILLNKQYAELSSDVYYVFTIISKQWF